MDLNAAFSWRLALTKYLPLLIIFFSATQLGIHFWPASSLVYGIRVDYLAPTLYLLDILIVAYLLVSNSLSLISKSLSPLFPLLLINLLFSQNPLSTLSWSLHFLLYFFFIYSLRPSYIRYSIGYILPLTLLFQVILATIQVALGHSVGGWLYYLGERTVSVGAPVVATGTFLGQTMLRAYGTFSHPNILAGYLVISYLIILRLVGLQSPKLANIPSVRGSDPLRKRALASVYPAIGGTGQTLKVIALPFIILGLFLTQSRAAAIAFFGLIIPFSLLHSLRSRLLYFVLLLSPISYLLSTGALSRPLDLSVSQRLSLQQISLQVIRRFPLFGTGANASISTYPLVALNPASPIGGFRLLQPDHDSFTLFLSWFGLFGALASIVALRYSDIRHTIYDFLPLTPLLLLDHYLLTSPQGLFILLLYFSLIRQSDKPTIRLSD